DSRRGAQLVRPVVDDHLSARRRRHLLSSLVFFLTGTATTELHPLSLHDALPISGLQNSASSVTSSASASQSPRRKASVKSAKSRSEEHTSELQSRRELVCRLLLEKKKTKHH